MSNNERAQSEANINEKEEDSEMEQVYKCQAHNIEGLKDGLKIFYFIIQPVIQIQIFEQRQFKCPNLINEQKDQIQILGENISQMPILTNETVDQIPIIGQNQPKFPNLTIEQINQIQIFAQNQSKLPNLTIEQIEQIQIFPKNESQFHYLDNAQELNHKEEDSELKCPFSNIKNLLFTNNNLFNQETSYSFENKIDVQNNVALKIILVKNAPKVFKIENKIQLTFSSLKSEESKLKPKGKRKRGQHSNSGERKKDILRNLSPTKKKRFRRKLIKRFKKNNITKNNKSFIAIIKDLLPYIDDTPKNMDDKVNKKDINFYSNDKLEEKNFVAEIDIDLNA